MKEIVFCLACIVSIVLYMYCICIVSWYCILCGLSSPSNRCMQQFYDQGVEVFKFVFALFCLFDVAAFKAENHNFGLGLFLNTYFHRLSVPWLYQKYLMLKTLTEQFDKFSVEYVQQSCSYFPYLATEAYMNRVPNLKVHYVQMYFRITHKFRAYRYQQL